MIVAMAVGGAIGYVLGTRSGRERYERIVRTGRRIGSSQRVQAAAGVARAQLDTATRQAGNMIADRARRR